MSEPIEEEVLSRTATNEAVTWRRGPFFCVRLSGKYAEDLALALREKVFPREESLAVDLSRLTGIPMHFARELYFAAKQRQAGEHRLVLVNPPEALRGLLRLISDRHGIPAVLEFGQLPADPKQVERQAKDLEDSLGRVRVNLETNALWQFVDRESCWVCPFCARSLDDAKVVSRMNVPPPVVEKIHVHVTLRCPKYDPNRPAMLDSASLAKAVERINSEKFAASRERAQELQSRVTKLEEKSKWADEMEKGLRIAVERQKHLLPLKPPEVPGVEIALVYRPAEQISGDFYDFVSFDDGRLGILIGDVSGHGIEAGILMGMTKKVLQIRVGETPDLRAAVVKANADICRELDKKSFVTAFVLVLDPVRKRLSCLRAGHNPALLVNPARTPEVAQLEPPGAILGMSAGAAFERALVLHEAPLQSGDLIALYTDGLEEAHNAEEEMFGRDRILGVLRREHAKPLPYVLTALSYEMNAFVGPAPQEDDVTIIGLRIT